MKEREKILEVRNLRWEAGGKTIIDIENFALFKGEIAALIGPNGAGKSSFVKLLSFLEKPAEGEFFFAGEKVAGDYLHIRRQMATVFQEPLLLSGSVFGNVAQGLRLRGIPKHQIEATVRYWLQRLGIEHLAERNIRFLSGGEAQRVSIARAMAVRPRVLFLDEPFASLDLPTRATLIEELGEIIREAGTTALFITHNVEEIPLIASRVCAMVDGRIVQDCSPEGIFRFPANEEVARLVGIENVLTGVLTEDRQGAWVGKNFLKFPLEQETRGGGQVRLFVRPEDVEVLEREEGKENVFDGIVQKILPLSSQLKLTIDCGFPLVALANKEIYFTGKVRLGSSVKIHLPPGKIHAKVEPRFSK